MILLKNKTYVLSIFLIALFLWECVPSKPIREEKDIPPGRVVKKVEANRRKISSFRATGVLDVTSPQMNAKANFEVIIKKPDSVKVSVFGPFGIELAQALITTNNFSFYDPINKKLYTGKNKKGVIEKILKVDLSFEDLMDALSGSVNLTNKLTESPYDFVITDESYLLSYMNNENKNISIYDINMESLALNSYKVFSDSKELILEAKYSNFKMIEEVAIPYKSHIEYSAKSQSLDIEYRSIKVNEKINDLELALPTDVQIVEW